MFSVRQILSNKFLTLNETQFGVKYITTANMIWYKYVDVKNSIVGYSDNNEMYSRPASEGNKQTTISSYKIITLW